MPPRVEDALVREWRGLASGRPLGKGEGLTGRELDAAARDLLRLQRGLTGSRALAGSPYMDDPALLGAYILYYWPSSFVQAGRALDRCLAFSGLPAPGRILDLGAGPGPAAAAFAARGALEICLIDPSPMALAAGGRLLGAIAGPGLRPSIIPAGSAGGGLGCVARTVASRGAGGGFDAIIVSHVLNELGHDVEERAEELDGLVDLLSPRGFLLLIEPALLFASRGLLALRDALLDRGLVLMAPCLWKGPCPALTAGPWQTCHDALDWEPPAFTLELARRAGLERPSLKMAWAAFSARRGPAKGGMENQGPADAPRTETCLVVSEPMLNKAGKTRFFFCGPSGRFTLSARLGALPDDCADFGRLRRGMLVELSGAATRADSKAAEAGAGRGLEAGMSLRIIG